MRRWDRERERERKEIERIKQRFVNGSRLRKRNTWALNQDDFWAINYLKREKKRGEEKGIFGEINLQNCFCFFVAN